MNDSTPVTNRRNFLTLAGSAAAVALTMGSVARLTEGVAHAEVGAMYWPTAGTVTSLIGTRTLNGRTREHNGIDIGAASGTAVYAAYAGTVSHKSDPAGFGTYVEMTHSNGWTTRYGHLSGYSTANGAQVARGQQIGRVGSTGSSTGAHLHFEARRFGARFTNLNNATSKNARVSANTPISVDFPGLGGTAGAATPDNPYFRGIVAAPPGSGYWLFARDGGVFSYEAPFHGSMGGRTLNAPVVGMAAHPSGGGYWLVGADGGIFAFGNAGFHGSMGGKALNKPIVGMAATPSGGGYWLVGADGGIFAFGNAGFHGSMGGKALNKPIVGMAAHSSGAGYWLVAADGGIFAFGNAGFHGSMGGKALNAPVVGMAAHPSGNGYWLTAGDGGVFAFANAGFYGSMGGKALNKPVVSVSSSLTGSGYWLTAGDGGVFAFGDARFVESGTNVDHD